MSTLKKPEASITPSSALQLCITAAVSKVPSTKTTWNKVYRLHVHQTASKLNYCCSQMFSDTQNGAHCCIPPNLHQLLVSITFSFLENKRTGLAFSLPAAYGESFHEEFSKIHPRTEAWSVCPAGTCSGYTAHVHSRDVQDLFNRGK